MMIIMGLGNPGEKYADTRHNAGFQCVDALTKKYGIAVNDRRAEVVCGQGRIEGEQVVLAKPRTYMNRSGQAATYLLARFQQLPDSLLVVYDDMDLPLGKIRLRSNGSAGGHNGIKSIIAELGVQEFPRLRIGIGRPEGDDAINHVLGGFSGQDARLMDKAILLAVEAIVCTLKDGIGAAMNRYNSQVIALDEA
ncbi:MAG: aminoacyl-tRNA hydrolase [Chloroflexi bacterium]|nr:aminoacyl-tRNA hydrolase [Chloroflexota bacterium]